MSEPEQKTVSNGEKTSSDVERTKQVEFVAWTAGLTAFFGIGALATKASWPMAVGVAALAVMVMVVCRYILQRR